MLLQNRKDKALHGLGLKSVKEIVKKYDGSTYLKQSGDEFEVIILMKNWMVKKRFFPI